MNDNITIFMVNERRVIPFSELSEADLRPGTAIGLSKVTEFDDLVVSIAGTMRTELLRDYPIYQGGLDSRPLSQMLKDQRKDFIGGWGNFIVTILQPDTTIIPQPDTVRLDTVVAFLAEADLYSSARKGIPAIQRLCSMYVRERKHGSADVKPYITMHSKPVQRRSIIGPIEQLNAESRRIWIGVLRRGLTTPYQGGLPGLGARR